MVIKRDFIYTPKGTNRPLHIHLPDAYYLSDERYPVMYFFDGHNLFYDSDATYGKSWGMADFMARWSKDMIIVGIECGHDGYERLSEYLPYPADRGSHFEKNKPLGKATMDWIVNEIKPMIDAQFRTIPFRECTGIGGSSMGGIMALYAGVHYNRWFSKAACISTAMGFCMGPLMADIRRSTISPDTRFFLSWGTHEAHGIDDPHKEDTSSTTFHNNSAVCRTLGDKGALARTYCQVEGYHCEASWESQIPLFMDYLWMQ